MAPSNTPIDSLVQLHPSMEELDDCGVPLHAKPDTTSEDACPSSSQLDEDAFNGLTEQQCLTNDSDELLGLTTQPALQSLKTSATGNPCSDTLDSASQAPPTVLQDERSLEEETQPAEIDPARELLQFFNDPGFGAIRIEQLAAITTASQEQQGKRARKEPCASRSGNVKQTRQRMTPAGEEGNMHDATSVLAQHFDEIDEAGREAQESYRKEAKRIQRKRKDGKMTDAEEMIFTRLQQQETRRRNTVRKNREFQHEQEQDVTMHDDHDDAGELFVQPDTNFEPLIQNRNGLAVSSRLDDDLTLEERNNSETGNRACKVRNTTARKSKRKGTRHTGPSMTDVGSLVTSNPIRDAQFLEDGEEDEGRLALEGTRRKDALRALVASLPAEHQNLAKVDQSVLDKAIAKLPRGSCKVADDGQWRIRGMLSSLKHFQVMGLVWMRERELSMTEPHGGLVADEMGLGKTVMTLANIVLGQASVKEARECKATLVIVPSSLVNQWNDEIKKHVEQDAKKTTIVWKSSKKGGIHSLNDRQLLCDALIVICTTYEVTKSCAKIVFPEHLQSEREKEEWLDKNRHKFRGVLHQIPWLRVVVDEAHCMKNHLSHASLAIRELDATYRWAVTGTPILNSPKELYPYFKFVGVPQTGNFRLFCSNYNTRTSAGQSRLWAVLNSIMLRRTYADKMFGQALVMLPRTSEAEAWVDLDDIEQFGYNLVYERIQENLSNMARKGTLHKVSNHHALTLLLRLRQASSHLLLVEQSMRDLLTNSDLEKMRKLCEAHERPVDQRNRDSLLDLRRMLKNVEKWKAATNEAPEMLMEEEPDSEIQSANTGGAYGLQYNFSCFLDKLKAGSRLEELRESLCCSACSADPAVEPHLTNCEHMYCKTCIHKMNMEAAASGQPAKCRTCQTIFDNASPFNPKVPIEAQPGGDDPEAAEPVAKKINKKTKKKRNDPVQLLSDTAGIQPLPSAKTRAIKAQILNWLETDPKVKVIVFTQFVPIIGILRRMCSAEKWLSVEFHGKMSREARDDAVKSFEKSDGPCIMIATLRTGGVGLNLTMASKVIIMDPWWNSSADMQAFGRVFRIGQKAQTSLLRLFARHTVDSKMYAMQQEKAKAIQGVMSADGDGQRQLTGEQHDMHLMQLFGLINGGARAAGGVDGDADEVEFVPPLEREGQRKRTIFEDGAYLMWNREGADKRQRRL